mgnify:CR=1 FL=1
MNTRVMMTHDFHTYPGALQELLWDESFLRQKLDYFSRKTSMRDDDLARQKRLLSQWEDCSEKLQAMIRVYEIQKRECQAFLQEFD